MDQRDINIHDIPFPQLFLIWEAMADNVVDRRATSVFVALVAQCCRYRLMGGREIKDKRIDPRQSSACADQTRRRDIWQSKPLRGASHRRRQAHKALYFQFCVRPGALARQAPRYSHP